MAAHHLVIQLARLGDLLQSKRLLASLAEEEGACVHLAVDGSLAGLARLMYPFATVHEVAAHAGNIDAAAVLGRNAARFAALKEISFSSVYNLNFSGLSLALCSLFDPDTVRGYKRQNGQILRSRWSRMAFRWTHKRRSAPLNLVDFWAHLHPNPLAPELVNPAAAPKGTGRMGVVLAGRQARRSLPPETLAACVEAVFTAMNGPRIALFGSAAERPLARQLSRFLRPALVQKLDDLCGATTLTDLPESIGACDCLLTPDTGGMHLAAALGVPVRAFFLSSAWCWETGPYGEGHRIWQALRSCAPCVETAPCPYDVACLAPFQDTSFLSRLRGKTPEVWPEGLAELESAFDPLGVCYTPLLGQDPEQAERVGQRATLAETLHVSGMGSPPEWAAQELLHESDWMLQSF